MAIRNLRIGDIVELTLPGSEVCEYMKVAGQKRKVKIVLSGAQILEPDGGNFSFPIALSEAGIYGSVTGPYIHVDEDAPDYGPQERIKSRGPIDRKANRPFLNAASDSRWQGYLDSYDFQEFPNPADIEVQEDFNNYLDYRDLRKPGEMKREEWLKAEASKNDDCDQTDEDGAL